MNTVQGKNVVILGGLQGVGLKLTINLLNKRVKNLYIIDIYDNQTKFIDLKTKFQTTNLFYKRIDELRFNTEIQRTIQYVCLKIQYIDLVINALELIVEKDLQRTMDLNMKIYLNTMMAARKVMDRTKGGRGGKIINILSNLGLQNWNIKNNIYGNYGFDQQYLINKQMLLSLTEAYSQDEFFQQTGVAVMCVMPTINKNLLRKNYDWVKKVGLERMVNVMNNWTDVEGLGDRFDIYNDNTKWFNGDYYGNNDFDQDSMTYNTNMDINDDYWYNLKNSQDFDGNFGDFSTMLTMLCFNIVLGIEMGKNGNKIVVGFKGIKNIQKQGVYSQL